MCPAVVSSGGNDAKPALEAEYLPSSTDNGAAEAALLELITDALGQTPPLDGLTEGGDDGRIDSEIRARV